LRLHVILVSSIDYDYSITGVDCNRLRLPHVWQNEVDFAVHHILRTIILKSFVPPSNASNDISLHLPHDALLYLQSKFLGSRKYRSLDRSKLFFTSGMKNEYWPRVESSTWRVSLESPVAVPSRLVNPATLCSLREKKSRQVECSSPSKTSWSCAKTLALRHFTHTKHEKYQIVGTAGK